MTKPSRDTSKAREAVSGLSLYFVESAVIESNMTEKPQSSASPAPQNIMSALLSWICSMPTPMQWAPVEHADEIEKDMPLSLKCVERTAETVEPMDRVTRYGPILRNLPSSTACMVSITSVREVPPCPRIPPTRGLSMSSGDRPASSMQRCIATKAYFALIPMKRACFRSIRSSSSISGRPHTCDFIPISLYLGLNLMPDLASFSEVDTSSSVLPRHDKMPIPVTTTRRPPGAPIETSEEREERTAGRATAPREATSR
mmetsp:Transcript_19643/g.63923  ORF Transcript_19643/g.63923 Transcript_19643/m.63923 type:complete len:258 (-) Transcript_19643:98-871(-)